MESQHPIDRYSYELGVIDCFCEMVASGLKTLAMSHPCGSIAERDEYLEDVKKLCHQYGIYFYPENDAFLTDLFPAQLNQGKVNFLFYRTEDVLHEYLDLKEKQKRLIQNGQYTGAGRREIAAAFGRLLSYPEEGINRLIAKNLQESI